MIGILSVSGIVAGAAIAYLARRCGRHHDTLEAVGGVLLIAGFALLGYSLDLLLGQP
jgi:hypothetical protein